MANKWRFEIVLQHIQKESPHQLREMLQEKETSGATPLHLLLGSSAKDGTTKKSEAKQDSYLRHVLRNNLPYIGDINAPDDADLTPVHHLFFFNGDMPKTQTLLLRHGADPWRQSRIGAMPIQLAKQAGQGSTTALFLAVAPDPASPTFSTAQYE